MKKIVIAFLSGLVLFGCADKKAEEKVALDSVVAIHDKVMAADDKLMKNKMQLDSLIKQKKISGSDTAKMLSQKLTVADSSMDTWMHNFDYEQKGKSHDEIMAYMAKQKQQITQIDSAIGAAVAASTEYLKKK